MLNGVRVEVLINTGCDRTLVKKAQGPFTSEVLSMQCIHGDIKEYRTKMGDQTFKCRLGIVPQLDCEALLGRDCPILDTILRQNLGEVQQAVRGFLGDTQVRGTIELPLQRQDLAPLMKEDPTLKFAIEAATDQEHPATEKNPRFVLKARILYRWIEGKMQLVVLVPLRPQVLSLAHDPPLSGHLGPDKNLACVTE